jgi:prepilin-type N-terminal cleavage/methylation domain-containing protein
MGANTNRGFTLIEILVVIVILGLIMAMAAVLLRSVTATQKRSVTQARLANVEAAILQFVMVQKRLPCPADGTQSASAGGAEGRPASGTCTATGATQQGGVVPWKSLGLSAADATDGWDRRFTYRVQAALTADNAMDMSSCDPAGTGGLAGGVCNAACTSATLANCTPPTTYLNGKGLTVKNLAGTDVMLPAATPPTGAAYVLISHGESGGGAYLSGGILSTSTLTDGTEEQKNYVNLALQAYYVDDQIGDVSGANHFDDIVARPSVLTIVNRAGLGPRSH